MNFRKFVAMASAGLIITVLTACDEKKNEKESSSEAEVQITEAETTTSVTESSESENVIKEILGTERDSKEDFLISKGELLKYNGVESHVIIPDGVRKIADGAFWSMDFISAVDIPASVEEIGNGAFWSCAGLKFINAEEGLKTINDTAFWSCPSLKDVNLPESVSAIGRSAFGNCPALTIHTPEGSYAEEYAYNSKISSDNTYAEFVENTGENVIRASQYAYEQFKEFRIEEDVTAIEACAFQYCKSLEKIDIPSAVKTIGGDAFEYCEKMVFVNINEGCTEIGDGAFEYCRALKDVNIPASVQKIEKSSFDYCNENLVIHTPKGSYAEEYAKSRNIPFDNNLIN